MDKTRDTVLVSEDLVTEESVHILSRQKETETRG